MTLTTQVKAQFTKPGDIIIHRGCGRTTIYQVIGLPVVTEPGWVSIPVDVNGRATTYDTFTDIFLTLGDAS